MALTEAEELLQAICAEQAEAAAKFSAFNPFDGALEQEPAAAEPAVPQPAVNDPTQRDDTLASLANDFQDLTVTPGVIMRDVIGHFTQNPCCIGALVLDGINVAGVVSRDFLGRELARPFYRELCERRPVSEFLKLCRQTLVILPKTMTISQAVGAALSRPVAERYEPVIVVTEKGRRLLDVPVILTAQCRLLNAAMKSLERSDRERQALHDQLVTASRQAGRAEVATGVLHNVGNVLNSVNVSASVLGRLIEQSKIPSLARAVALMKENHDRLGSFLTNDERGKRLPSFLEKLSETLASEQTSLAEELKSLHQGVDHIKHVVQMQQAYAKESHISMRVEPCELMDEALKMNLVSFERHSVAIERKYDEGIPQLWIDKHKVLQILINLISNAKNALKPRDVAVRTITVAVSFKPATKVLVYTVTDTGIGIDADNLTRIFSHGFTTRREGHGFGLHSSANGAQEMGGTLSAFSNGLGQGATFTLEIPADQREKAQ